MSSRFLQQLRREHSVEPAGQARQLFYVLTPPLSLDLVVAREQPNGRLDGAHPYRLQAAHLRQPPPFLRDADLALLTQLAETDESWLQTGRGDAVKSWAWLSKLLATRRARSPQGQPLLAGAAMALQPGWRSDDQGGQYLTWLTPRNCRVVPVDPPAYWDIGRSELGPIDSPLARAAFAEIRKAPYLDPEDIDDFVSRRGDTLTSLGLPLPTPIQIAAVSSRAQPHLHFYHRPGGRSAGEDCLRLQFSYQHQAQTLRFDHADPAQEKDVFDADQQTLYRVQRNPQQENEWEQALYLALEGYEPQPLSGAEITFANRAGWRQVMTEAVPELKRQGWTVSIDPDFRHNFVSVDRVEVAAHWLEQNWFELALTVRLDDEPLPLLPLLTDCAQRYTREQLMALDTDTELPLTLPDGRRLLLPVPKLLHWLNLLVELDDETTGESLRLPAAQLHRLKDMAVDGLASDDNSQALLSRAEDMVAPPNLESFQLPTTFTAQLRTYQQLGVAWLQQRRQLGLGGILADDMGLGKTVQTLAHLSIEREAGRLAEPTLVVAPSSVLHNWRQEAERFAPQLRCALLHGLDRHTLWESLANYHVVLTSYALLVKDIDYWLSQPLSGIILDEAQAIKNPRAQISRQLRRLEAPYRLCLTGTPLENHLGELWSQFDFLMPRFLDSEQSFRRRYRKPIEKDGNQARAQALMERIGPFLLRRTKEEVATDLPPKTEVVIKLPLPDEQAEVYETLRQQCVASLKENPALGEDNEDRILILNALMQLRQACCDPSLVDDSYRDLPSAKREHLMEMLVELVDEGRSVLVFSQFTRMLDRLATDLKRLHLPHILLTGASKNREQLVQRFQDGEVPIFLISLKAGGTGLNLTRADTVIHYDPWWNSAAEAQATDRAYRIGQTRPVFVYKLLAESTVEEKIHALQQQKRELLQQVYNVAEARTQQLTLDNAALLALLD